MEITSSEARAALAAADEAVLAVKRALDRQASWIVLLWGIVYVLAPLAMHVWPVWGVIPQQLLLVGAIGLTIYKSYRTLPISGPNARRIGGLWWLTFSFAWVWLLILDPDKFWNPAANGQLIARQMWAYGVSLAMFVYVVMGLWIGRLYVVTGVGITLLTLFGLLAMGEWYWLWCAVTGGGTLLALGFWLRWQR